ncbi:MAG: sterol desaturase family protein [Methyloprofundus sp.]|nr:sterol desaturase family protein [Methyloprofundus sp.]
MEALVRLGVALGIFLLMVSWEYFSPRRDLSLSRQQRWPVNIGLALLNMLIVRVTVGGIAYLSAIHALDNQWGLLNFTELPQWFAVLVTLLVLDVVIYFQHRIAHIWQPLWRLHQVHHTDIDFDVTTAVRFHPLEIIFSLFIKVGVVYALGANPLAVIAFEIILNGAATFNHSNINLPLKLDKVLRWFVVTPDMHRIHHSCLREERDSNYGFSISLWDRIFASYTAKPQQPQEKMLLGLRAYRKAEQVSFWQSLLLPFKALK